MKVKELMELLKGFDSEFDVVLARDAEGNGFSLLSADGLGEAYYSKEDRQATSPDDADRPANAVVFWP